MSRTGFGRLFRTAVLAVSAVVEAAARQRRVEGMYRAMFVNGERVPLRFRDDLRAAVNRALAAAR